MRALLPCCVALVLLFGAAAHAQAPEEVPPVRADEEAAPAPTEDADPDEAIAGESDTDEADIADTEQEDVAPVPTTAPGAAAAAETQEPSDTGVEVTFEPGDGLAIRSRDEQFSMVIRPRVQLLATITAPEDDETPAMVLDAGDFDLGLELRRVRVSFTGNFFGPANRYKIELAFSPRDMGVDDGIPTRTPLLDYYLDFRHLRELSVRIGQYKLPFNRERVISSGDLQMVDRSIVNGALNIDRDIGFDLRSTDFLGLGWLRYYVGMSTGEGRDGGFGNDLAFVYFARLEVLPLGRFDDYDQADLARRETPRLSIGAAYAFLDDARNQRGILGNAFEDRGTADYHTFTADMVFMWAGLSLHTELIWRGGTRNQGVDDTGALVPIVTPPSNGLGWFAQAGYLVPEIDLELAARYALLAPIGERADTSFPERGELGASASYYFAGHAFKLQLDYFHLWANGAFDAGEDRVRLQLQAAL